MNTSIVTDELQQFLSDSLKEAITKAGSFPSRTHAFEPGPGEVEMNPVRYVGKRFLGQLSDESLKQYASFLEDVFKEFSVTHIVTPALKLELNPNAFVLIAYMAIDQKDIGRFDMQTRQGCSSCSSCASPCQYKKTE